MAHVRDMQAWMSSLDELAAAANAADLANAADAGLRAARDVVPVDTGELRDSLVVEQTDGGFTIGSPLPYAGVNEARRGFIKAGFDAAIAHLRANGYR